MTLTGAIIPPYKYTQKDLTFVVYRQPRHTQVKFFYVARVKIKNYEVMPFLAY